MTTVMVVKCPMMMLVDSQASDGDMFRQTNKKIRKIHIPLDMDSILAEYKIPADGMDALVGYSGYTQAGAEFIHWCKRGLPMQSRPRFEGEHVINAVLLLQNSTLLRFDYICFPFEIEQDVYAVGSGRDFAIGAIEAYKDFVEMTKSSKVVNQTVKDNMYYMAMIIACKFDIYSAEPIIHLKLES